MRIPKQIMDSSVIRNFTLGLLIDRHGELEEQKERKYFRDDDTIWLLGHRLPPFQRPAVWTESQKIRFIESAWMGISLSTWMINRCTDFDQENFVHPTDLWLLDGQQRFRALKAYLDGEFKVFGLWYSELNELEKRRFSNVPFSCIEIYEKDEQKLRKLYDLHNFGGLAHTEDQRAT